MAATIWGKNSDHLFSKKHGKHDAHTMIIVWVMENMLIIAWSGHEWWHNHDHISPWSWHDSHGLPIQASGFCMKFFCAANFLWSRRNSWLRKHLFWKFFHWDTTLNNSFSKNTSLAKIMQGNRFLARSSQAKYFLQETWKNLTYIVSTYKQVYSKICKNLSGSVFYPQLGDCLNVPDMHKIIKMN